MSLIKNPSIGFSDATVAASSVGICEDERRDDKQ